MATGLPATDSQTRERLLEAATRLFAERGFQNVTVRDICREAGANVAAVNYHFRDKLGLYTEVWKFALEGMTRTYESVIEAGAGKNTEEKLHAYIRTFLHHLLAEEEGNTCWVDRLVARETAEPTPAFDVLIEVGILPKFRYLCGLVGELLRLPAEEERVLRCASSVQSQCLMYRYSKPFVARMTPGLAFTDERIDAIADHITKFSLAGIRAISEQQDSAGHAGREETPETASQSPANRK